MSRHGLTALDHEPKNLGVPPPSYRSTVIMDTDTWSQYSSSSAGLMKRRNSWTNLVESDENLNKHKVNCYPKVTTPFKQAPLSSANSVASDFQTTDIYRQYVPRGSLPVLADPSQLHIRPAGSLPTASRGPSKAPSVAMSPMPGSSIPPKTPIIRTKRNRLQEWKQRCCKPMVLLCCFLIVVVAIVAAIVAIVLTHVLPPPDKLSMNWYPPESVRGTQNQSSSVQMSGKGNQVRLQLQGGFPFKGSYISYYNFDQNNVVVVDESLKGNGRNLACFVLPLDRGNIPNANDMRKAAAASKSHNSMSTGWQESWMWLPQPMMGPPVAGNNTNMPECQGARWIQLTQAPDQRNRKCTDCFDFCLPDYGIEGSGSTKFLNIMRRDCFYLFVPEWRSYAQANSIEQNQRDFETYYRNRMHLNPTYGGPNGESKWIPLSVPRGGMQNVANQTGQFMGNMGNIPGAFQNTAQGVSNTVFGNNQGQPGLYGNAMNTVNNAANQAYTGLGNVANQAYSGVNNAANQAYNGIRSGLQSATDAVSGVVNLNGVNGNTNTGPNTNGQQGINGQMPNFPSPNGLAASSNSQTNPYGLGSGSNPNNANLNGYTQGISGYGPSGATQVGQSSIEQSRYGNGQLNGNGQYNGNGQLNGNGQYNGNGQLNGNGQYNGNGQLNGVNSQNTGGYIPTNQQNTGLINSITQSSPYRIGENVPYTTVGQNTLGGPAVAGAALPQNYNGIGTGSSAYSGDVVRVPASTRYTNTGQLVPTGDLNSGSGYTPNLNLAGTELSRYGPVNSPYPSDVHNFPPNGPWVGNPR